MKTTIVYFFLLIISTNSIFAQIGENDYDPRVKKNLDDLSVKYAITENNNFKLIFNTEKNGDGRTQLVIINSNTEKYDEIEVREIFSVIKKGKNLNELDESILQILLKRNDTIKMGSWCISEDENSYYIVFAIKAGANMNKTMLESILSLIAAESDKVEKEIFGGDIF